MKRGEAAAADDADTDDSRKITAERTGIGAGDPDGDWDWAGLVDGDIERDEAAAADDATVNDSA
ncbi:hypothetical protein GTA08_BOTSDO04931 [Botryosphaeria dothidea]|uniref:Uncharacterized protein n=1 Tax=Botryosphaeria dothidea TaxID=55169 RepID=A0A8H4IW36_9PEZI|nr:hypothetical protein GTA08_BOTSDO04931 [Botryosphaeria dothidea]